MRVLFLTTYFLPDTGANALLMAQLAEELARFGHEVTVVTSLPHYEHHRISAGYRRKLWIKEDSAGLVIYRVFLYVPKNKNSLIGRAISYLSWNILSAWICLATKRADILFVPSPPLTNGAVAWMIGLLRRVPFIYNVQDIYPDIAARLGLLKNRIIISGFKLLEMMVYSGSEAVCVISDGFRLNLLSKGVPKHKLHVIPNFVDTEFMRPLPRRNSFSADREWDGRFVVLFAGNVGLSQGLEGVLTAADRLRDHSDILFAIVGSGASKSALARQAEILRLDNVRFYPFFPRLNVPEMYASSDVCLVPLKRGLAADSVPSKVYTILAAARPLIASVDENSDTWTLVKKAECGLCVRPEDPHELAEAIAEIYHHRELGLRMGANGRKYVEEHHSRSHTARKYERLFQSVIERRG
jgi:colanic acid biosynthesis glycosyl transferase WcaI